MSRVSPHNAQPLSWVFKFPDKNHLLLTSIKKLSLQIYWCYTYVTAVWNNIVPQLANFDISKRLKYKIANLYMWSSFGALRFFLQRGMKILKYFDLNVMQPKWKQQWTSEEQILIHLTVHTVQPNTKCRQNILSLISEWKRVGRRDLTTIAYVAQNIKCHCIRIKETSRIEQLRKRRKRTKIICLTLMYSDRVKMLTVYHDFAKP